MDIKLSLEKRVAFCTKLPECSPKRAVLFIWDEKDQNAKIFCHKLAQIECGKAVPVPIDNKEQLNTQLEINLRAFQERIDIGELSCPYGVYLLVIGTTRELYDSIDRNVIERYFPIYFTDYCRLSHIGEASKLPPCLLLGTEWRVDRDAVLAIYVVLLKASYESKLLAEESGLYDSNNRIFRLEVTEYNAIREDLCRSMIQE